MLKFKKRFLSLSFKELAELIIYTRPFLNLVSKAKAAKLVRNLIDMYLDLEAGTGERITLNSNAAKSIDQYWEYSRYAITL